MELVSNSFSLTIFQEFPGTAIYLQEIGLRSVHRGFAASLLQTKLACCWGIKVLMFRQVLSYWAWNISAALNCSHVNQSVQANSGQFWGKTVHTADQLCTPSNINGAKCSGMFAWGSDMFLMSCGESWMSGVEFFLGKFKVKWVSTYCQLICE